MNTLLYIASLLFIALSVMDVLFTLKLQTLGAIENNPLLGKHPKPATIVTFGILTTAVWLTAAVLLAVNDAPGIELVFGLGIALRGWVVVKGWKLMKELSK